MKRTPNRKILYSQITQWPRQESRNGVTFVIQGSTGSAISFQIACLLFQILSKWHVFVFFDDDGEDNDEDDDDDWLFVVDD